MAARPLDSRRRGRLPLRDRAQDLAGNTAASAPAAVDVKELTTFTIGRSVRGRPITVTRFGGAGRRLLVVGGVHGNESGTPVARQLVSYLLAHPRALPAQTRIDVLVCANPDGYARRTRGNARDVDLNRNLPTRNWRRRLGPLNEPGAPGLTGGSTPGSEPETKALLAHLRGRFDVVVSLHSRGGIIDCSGPGARAIGRRMSALSGLPVSKLWYDPYITGSLGRFVPERYRIPIITVELTQLTASGPGCAPPCWPPPADDRPLAATRRRRPGLPHGRAPGRLPPGRPALQVWRI